MPPSVARSSSTLQSSSSGRRIISKITSPFSSKPRNLVDFQIHPDDPHKQHSPGDVVTGSVRLRVVKPFRVTHISVCLHGFVQVYKNPGSPPADGFRANGGYQGTGRGKKHGEYFGNGFASLFEDEVVLCGEGRLGEGAYQFNFELEFPDRDLPSSIDFERGTISYMITATVTRPTTILPTASTDHKIYFLGRIDISPLYPPKPKTIRLEPIPRRSRAKTQARKLVDQAERKGRRLDPNRDDQHRESRASSAPSTQNGSEPPCSPAPSEISFESVFSSNGGTSLPDSSVQSPGASEQGKLTNSKASLVNKTITVTVESLAGGCLRGDNLTTKISIVHTKHVKSLYGVIVTLYRLARVDMHPTIPLGPTEKGSKEEYEDYYPKSFTGLGGLSLSGAGSSHVFRKDLSQALMPLIVDPTTLTSEITAKVRVPEEAFPTISTVPGAMISFKYYIEVVVDVQGKLAGQDRNLGNVGGLTSPSVGVYGTTVADGSDSLERNAFAPAGSNFIDTAGIRRDKSVVTWTFEVIVGTRDSERKNGKRRLDALPTPQPSPPRARTVTVDPSDIDRADGDYYLSQEQDVEPGWFPYHGSHDHYGARDETYSQQLDEPPPITSPPQMPDETELPEKERLRRAEARLLPSQPPGQANEPAYAPSAPFLHEAAADDHGPGPSAPEYGGQSWSAMSHPALHFSNAVSSETAEEAEERPAAPKYSHALTGSALHDHCGEDKQELERQRLLLATSVPPDGFADADRSPPAAYVDSSAPQPVDGIEVANEEADIRDSHADASARPGLPEYAR